MQTALPACYNTPSWLLAVLLFFLSSFLCHSLSHMAAVSLSVSSCLTLGYLLLNSCLAFALHLSIIPPACECFFFLTLLLSIHHLLAKAVNKWITASLHLVPDIHGLDACWFQNLIKLILPEAFIFQCASCNGAKFKYHIAQMQGLCVMVLCVYAQ